MTDIGADTFDAIYDTLAEARGQIRIGTHVITEVLCTNIDLTRESTEQGLYKQASITARIKRDDEDPSYPLTIDKVIELNHLASGQWVKLRIAARRDIAGIIALVLETPYE